ncbi:TPA: helicase [Candidatus Poribacteria bacterium]|nr:helicase [Candidatus Poribacteria bacterium]
MPHDIIDNRKEQLLEHIWLILSSTERAHFAVGYLFLSGLKPIREQLEKLTEIRLLIGNTTNRETLETLAEGYKRLDLLQDAAEDWLYQKRVVTQQVAQETAENLRDAMSLMDQTDEDEATVRTVLRLIEEKRLKVRVYTKGRLHAKAYIFDYGDVYDSSGNPIPREEEGIAIVGSSNLTLSGISHNTELNVVVHGNQNHAELARWFEELWDEALPFDAALMQELKQSWALQTVSPYDIYMKTLYELVKDRLEDEERREILWDDAITRDLADFQKVAVRQAVQMIKDWGGCFAADVVGLGKSYIGAAVVKHFERTEHARPLIICPAGLVEMWERYNEVYQLNARVLSMGLLRESDDGINFLLDNVKYRDRDFVLVDESHNFRHSDTQRYRLLQGFLTTGRRCLFLTATPRNKSVWDVYNQIKLFHPDDRTDLPISPPNLREFFRGIEQKEKRLPDVLVHLLIRRTRNHILRWYGFDAETHQPVDPSRFREYFSGKRRAYIIVGGKHQFFPKRELSTITYSIEDTYQGLYQKLRGYLGHPRFYQTSPLPDELTYARYGLWHYVISQKQKQSPYTELHQAGANLRGLMRVMLFKRFESSVHAFRETLKRLLRIHSDVLTALSEDIVPAGEEAQRLLYESDQMEESELFDALRQVSGRYNIADFRIDLLKEHISQDIRLLSEMLQLVAPITPDKDDKLQTLKKLLNEMAGQSPPLPGGKRLIFTQYADTAQYLYDNLNPNGLRDDIDVIYSGDKSRERLVGRFAPKANPWFRFHSGETELSTVVATDVLSEGLNLQDCDKIINYDLHWNPVRLIQRFGRIDRIGSEHDRIFAFNFLPETGIERELGLREKLRRRINEIHETIGEDAAILDPTEQLNEEAMYAIYERKGEQLSLFEEDEEEPMDLNEAEEFLRQMRQENPDEFERIANLRDGIRTGKKSASKGIFAFFRAGRYQQLLLLDTEGNVVSSELSETFRAIQCSPDEPAQPLPPGYNSALMRAKTKFDEEVKHRIAQRDHTTSLTRGQRYVLRELRTLFNATKDDDARADITLLEGVFRRAFPVAVTKELNLLRNNGVTGYSLLGELKRIYFQYNLKEFDIQSRWVEYETSQIVCSSALV